jgi:hypothetical protein
MVLIWRDADFSKPCSAKFVECKPINVSDTRNSQVSDASESKDVSLQIHHTDFNFTNFLNWVRTSLRALEKNFSPKKIQSQDGKCKCFIGFEYVCCSSSARGPNTVEFIFSQMRIEYGVYLQSELSIEVTVDSNFQNTDFASSLLRDFIGLNAKLIDHICELDQRKQRQVDTKLVNELDLEISILLAS